MLPLITIPLYALTYEQIGRRIPIAFALIATCVCLYGFPVAAPNFTIIVFLRAMIGVTNSMIIGCPLIVDSIKKESRGRAISMQTFSIAFAQAFANILLVPMTIDMTYDQSFSLCAGAMAVLCFFAINMVREPNKQRRLPEGMSETSSAIEEGASTE